MGGRGESKLIVSLSLGSPAEFKWKPQSCSGGQAGPCWLKHGDFLGLVDGECQVEFVHCTSPGLVGGRMYVTFRGVRRHGRGCPLAAAAASWLPTCAQGSSVSAPSAGVVGVGSFWGSSIFVDWPTPLLVCRLRAFPVTLKTAGTVVAQHTFF